MTYYIISWHDQLKAVTSAAVHPWWGPSRPCSWSTSLHPRGDEAMVTKTTPTRIKSWYIITVDLNVSYTLGFRLLDWLGRNGDKGLNTTASAVGFQKKHHSQRGKLIGGDRRSWRLALAPSSFASLAAAMTGDGPRECGMQASNPGALQVKNMCGIHAFTANANAGWIMTNILTCIIQVW